MLSINRPNMAGIPSNLHTQFGLRRGGEAIMVSNCIHDHVPGSQPLSLPRISEGHGLLTMLPPSSLAIVIVFVRYLCNWQAEPFSAYLTRCPNHMKVICTATVCAGAGTD